MKKELANGRYWVTYVEKGQGEKVYGRKDIIKVASEFYGMLYSKGQEKREEEEIREGVTKEEEEIPSN